jgi:nicotinate-nucleotide adenylyltransferase
MSGQAQDPFVAVFGGTFDPVHYGHLRTAYELKHKLRFDEVRFVPCGEPPHRTAPITPADVRVRMLEAAIGGEPGFAVDLREIERKGPSYTVDTLRSLREDLPTAPLCLLLGMDAFLDLPLWHEWHHLLDHAHVVVAHRPGWQAPRHGQLGELIRKHVAASPQELRESRAGKIHIEPVTQLEVSSTELRRSIRAGIDAKYLLPDSVWRIIVETRCYASPS